MRLVTRGLPYICRRPDFALKGGTAINLFFRELPRLSVDIDLVFLPITPRDEALRSICRQLNLIARDIRIDNTPQTNIVVPEEASERSLRIWLTHRGHRVKIEVTPVARGTVWPPAMQRGKQQAELEFGYLESRVASFEDVYAGKMCAALDRQHPRDLFDIKELLAHEGIDRKLFKTFLVYLLASGRPMSELLEPRRKDIGKQYQAEFCGMVLGQNSLGELVETREQLLRKIHSAMTDNDRVFLMSIKDGNPDWSLIDLPGIERLPAIQWKLKNLGKMTRKSRRAAACRLAAVLGSSEISS